MNKRDIHNLIEQQDPETKQRIWERISSQIDVTSTPQQTTATKAKSNNWKWAVAVAVLVVVTLSVVLPITLTGDGVRYCDMSQYTSAKLGQTLREYSSSHNNELLYVDWYDFADEISTVYAHMNENKDDIVFFEETIVNGNTGDTIIVAITDNKTKVDKFERYYENCQELPVSSVTVKWKTYLSLTLLATFEYKNHIYYLQLDGDNGKDQLVEIIQNMLPQQ